MKKEKWFEKFTDIDDEFIIEAKESGKVKKATRLIFKRILPIAAAFCFVLCIAYYAVLPNMTLMYKVRYGDYGILAKEAYKAEKESRRGRGRLFKNGAQKGLVLEMTDGVPKESGDTSNGNSSYVETTDNQVADVTESDLIKRSSTHIFQCDGQDELNIYKIENKSATLVSSLSAKKILQGLSGEYYVSGNNHSIFLSKDCKTLTWIMMSSGIVILSVDVSVPESPKVIKNVKLDGFQYNTRVADGKLFLFAVSSFYYDDDLEKMVNQLPKCTENGKDEIIAPEKIVYPQNSRRCGLTSIYVFDEKTLEKQGYTSVFSIVDVNSLYMNSNSIYVINESDEKSEIMRLCYEDGEFIQKGSITVDGKLENQYFADEYENTLRVVTTVTDKNNKFNASLFVIDSESMKLKASLEMFAPVGESVKSVRFKENCAYVCTAVQEKYIIKDPVYYIDLSDVNNITSKNTGTIDGLSFHLVELRDGYLLGIGQDSNGNLKLEMYKENETEIECVTSKIYENSAWNFSQNCKAYYVDRENMTFGFSYYDFDTVNSGNEALQNNHSILLKFNGSVFETLCEKDDVFGNVNYGLDYSRFLVIEDVFYSFPCGVYTGTLEIGK